MRDVALAAGVSRTTVSHILNGESARGYNAVTCRRVMDAANRLGYRRNAAAQAISRGRFASLALLQDARIGRTWLDPELIIGLSDRLVERGCLLTVATYDDSERPADLPRIVAEIAADALLLNYHTELPPLLMDAITSGPPAIWLNRQDRAECVWHDDHGAGALAVRTLLGLGHRRIAYLDPRLSQGADYQHYSRRDRHRGYADAMAAAGLVPVSCEEIPRPPFPDDQAWMRAVLDRHPECTALIANFWPGHLAGLAATRRDPPAVLAVCDPVNADGGLHAHIAPDWQAMGRIAVDLALERIAEPGPSRPGRAVPPRQLWLDRLRPPSR